MGNSTVGRCPIPVFHWSRPRGRRLSTAKWVVALTVVGVGWAAPAAAQTWNLNANGNWGTAANWTPTTVPNAIDASATLGNIITVPRTVTLDVPVTIGTLNLSGSNAYTVSGANALTFDVSAGTAALNVTGTASPTISTGIVLNDPLALSQASTGTLTLSGIISGTGALTTSGTGTVNLTGANTYSGTTTISAGTLSVGAGGATGTLGTGAVVNNATLQINRTGTLTIANDISGTGALSKVGTSTTTLTGTNT
jgi:autotransporter-associated beta strand protein